jgi:hypothetical protein
MTTCVIYDYETLGTDPKESVVVALAVAEFNLNSCKKAEYTFDGLYEDTKLFLFDVEEQVVEYGRKIDKSTLDWWQTDVSKTVRDKCFHKDNRVSIERIPFIFQDFMMFDPDYVFSRGNTFDPIFTSEIHKQLGTRPAYPFWKDRDTRSFLDAYLWDTEVKNSFIPTGLNDKDLHDPETDIIIDILRIQTVLSNVG